MGRPKMLLPWGDATVLEQVISVFVKAGIDDILVVTGGDRSQVEDILARHDVRTVYNQDYARGEMLASLQCGLRDLLQRDVGAAMIGLGDQPQVQERTVQLVRENFMQTGNLLIIPSFRMRRGHPWLASRQLWGELLQMNSSQTPRDFLAAHASDIQYVRVDTPSILADLDTPEDYRAFHP
jgi:molybdenum cofactor cytidylyltransferase